MKLEVCIADLRSTCLLCTENATSTWTDISNEHRPNWVHWARSIHRDEPSQLRSNCGHEIVLESRFGFQFENHSSHCCVLQCSWAIAVRPDAAAQRPRNAGAGACVPGHLSTDQFHLAPQKLPCPTLAGSCCTPCPANAKVNRVPGRTIRSLMERQLWQCVKKKREKKADLRPEWNATSVKQGPVHDSTFSAQFAPPPTQHFIFV